MYDLQASSRWALHAPLCGASCRVSGLSESIGLSAERAPRPQIIFDTYGKLTGAQIKTFLLEKVRVVKHSAMERNYHIFYMLAAGASEEEKESWAMGDLRTHHFTSQSGCFDRRDGVLDSDLFHELIDAFHVMGFHEEEKVTPSRPPSLGGGGVGGVSSSPRWVRRQ